MTPFDANRTVIGDCRETLRFLPAETFNCCVTSPPYWGLRDYQTAKWEGGRPDCDHKNNTAHQKQGSTSQRIGRANVEAQRSENFRGECPMCGAVRVDGQLGLESTPDEYVAKMVEVFREVRRVLREDGTLWLNLGDSYAGGGGYAPNAPCNVARANGEQWGALNPAKMDRHEAKEKPAHARKAPAGLKPKDLVGIPWLVAFALRADGWYLRSEIIWHKPNPMPESVTDRPTKAHEQIFLFAKGQWVSRVVQFADIVGERLHFGKHIGSKEPPMREPFTKFCVLAATAIFNGAQLESDYSLPPFYAEEWKQSAQSGGGELIANLPREHRLAAISARLLNMDVSTKGFLEEIDRLWFDLGASDRLLIGRVLSPLRSPSVYVDSDGAVAVHHSGEVCQFKFGHGEIVWRRPTTCKYYYDAKAIAEPSQATPESKKRAEYGRYKASDSGAKRESRTGRPDYFHEEGNDEGGDTRNKRSVWTVATQPYSGSHFATFPPDLIKPCILAGAPAGGVVLDPFMGSGTVGEVSEALGRRWFGCELNPEYGKMIAKRTAQTGLIFADGANRAE